MGPICQALILCNKVTKGPLGATALVDLMAIVRFAEFPTACEHAIYFSLAGGKGREAFRFQIVGPEDEILFEENPEMDFSEPSEDYFGVIRLNAQFKIPGMYFYRLWYGDAMLSQRFLKVDYRRADPRAYWKK